MRVKDTEMRGVLEDILLPYQLRWFDDPSRFKIGMWSRQTGKSFGTAAEAAWSCVVEPGVSWVVLSAGERQALEWMAKARQWAEAFRLAVSAYDEIRASANAVITRSEIRFAGGSRIVAIPANPDTARGYSANLILDEFAVHEKPWDIWAAIYPSITNPLTGLKRLRVVSTPKGRANKFYDLWTKNDAYSKHKVTILDAAADGLPVDIAELKAGVDDPDIWAQEYMCEFIDSSAVLLPYEMIAACETDDPSDPGEGDVYMGYDVGRRKDLSVLVTAVRAAGVLHVVSVETFRAMPFHEQLAVLKDRIGAGSRVRRCCIDSTGIGAMLAEEARRACGPKAQGVDFTAKSKAEMYTALRRAFEDQTVRVPCDRDLREDLHAVVRNVSSGGAVSYSAPRNEDGHSDRAAALALCLRAALQKAGPGFMPRPWTPLKEAAL